MQTLWRNLQKLGLYGGVFIIYFLPQSVFNDHKVRRYIDKPSHCVTFIIGIGIHRDKFPCPHN